MNSKVVNADRVILHSSQLATLDRIPLGYYIPRANLSPFASIDDKMM